MSPVYFIFLEKILCLHLGLELGAGIFSPQDGGKLGQDGPQVSIMLQKSQLCSKCHQLPIPSPIYSANLSNGSPLTPHIHRFFIFVIRLYTQWDIDIMHISHDLRTTYDILLIRENTQSQK